MALDIQGMAPLLQVFDMPTAIRFYRDVIGFELVGTSGGGEQSDWVLLRQAGVELMLNTAYEADTRPPTPDATRIASHADVGLFFGCSDLESAYAHLVAKGVKAEPPKVAPYGMKQLYVTDPDGYVLCFQWPASEETRAQWRKSYGFEAANQTGHGRRCDTHHSVRSLQRAGTVAPAALWEQVAAARGSAWIVSQTQRMTERRAALDVLVSECGIL